MKRCLIALASVGCLLLAACSPDPATSPPATTPAPSESFSSAPGTSTAVSAVPWKKGMKAPTGDAFYVPPVVPAGAKAGDLIWSVKLKAPKGSKGWAMLYWSTALDGSLVPVSGVTFEPVRNYKVARPILAWAHGTFGLGDQCAPSHGFFQGAGASVPLVKAAVKEGLIFTATDYRGLGTPGPHPYLVNQTAGRDVLDSIRAAAQVTKQKGRPDALVMGQSQGGGAALLAAELQTSYAPELRLRGAVGVSVPSDLEQLDSQLSGGPYYGYVLMAIDGYRSVYPKLVDDTAKLTASGKAALGPIAVQCTEQILSAYAGRKESDYGTAKVLQSADFRAELAQNEPGQVRTSVPIFLVHGDDDDTIPVQNSRDLLARYCAQQSPVTQKTYPGAGHVDVLGKSLADIVPYFRNRLAQTPLTSSCPKS